MTVTVVCGSVVVVVTVVTLPGSVETLTTA